MRKIPDTNAKGFTFEEDFERTEVFRDTQTTAKSDQGETLFLDDNGKTWPASQLTIRPITSDQLINEALHPISQRAGFGAHDRPTEAAAPPTRADWKVAIAA